MDGSRRSDSSTKNRLNLKSSKAATWSVGAGYGYVKGSNTTSSLNQETFLNWPEQNVSIKTDSGGDREPTSNRDQDRKGDLQIAYCQSFKVKDFQGRLRWRGKE